MAMPRLPDQFRRASDRPIQDDPMSALPEDVHTLAATMEQDATRSFAPVLVPLQDATTRASTPRASSRFTLSEVHAATSPRRKKKILRVFLRVGLLPAAVDRALTVRLAVECTMGEPAAATRELSLLRRALQGHLLFTRSG